ncbi:MAG TPA: hypothetical protein VFA05_08120 [Gaiellaceae bacterium]|nr:hypothetical protein [Gaiellaceae bacterium]
MFSNPFRSEATAFRFVLATLVYLGLIAVAYFIWHWLALIVFVVLSLGIVWWLRRDADRPAPVVQAPAPSPPGEHRILVVANETVGGPELRSEIEQRAGNEHAKVLVVAPALNSPLRHWASDEDDARAAAQARVERSVESLRAVGIDASGEVGDGDPLQAIEDAIRTFRPDELIVSTHPEGKSHWLERGVVAEARSRFALPLTHVVVDLDADQS